MTNGNEINLLRNDVYFLEVVNGKIVINYNYEGILIFNSNLELIRKVMLSDDMTICSTLKKDDEILLICSENGKIIHVDLNSAQFKIIPLLEFSDWIFSRQHIWNENEIILSDYKGNLVKLDLVEGSITKVDRISEEMHLEEAQTVKEVAEFANPQFHAFEILEEYIVGIGEDNIVIRSTKDKREEHILPEKGYCFLSGKIMREKNNILLFLLCGNKADECNVKIKKYVLCP